MLAPRGAHAAPLMLAQPIIAHACYHTRCTHGCARRWPGVSHASAPREQANFGCVARWLALAAWRGAAYHAIQGSFQREIARNGGAAMTTTQPATNEATGNEAIGAKGLRIV